MTTAFPLPPLRQELRVDAGAPLPSGAPGFILFDPLRHLFFQIGALEQRVAAHWRRGEAHAVRDALVAEGEDPEAVEDAIVAFHEFATANSLVRDQGVPALAARDRAARRDWWRWVLDHYLFIRVPLVRPAAFLTRTLPQARRLWSRTGLTILALLAFAGLFLVTRQWDAFTGSFANLLSAQGLLAYGGALVVVKICHELGHAYTATRYGVRVPTMGVSFLVMVPVLYTDTSGAWRLRARRQRIAIDAAGILAELSVASVALFLWPFLPDGPLRTGAFVLATTSLATSLLVNASPFMRFDGYYILSDLLGVPNLASRAFAVARWRFRELLFALREPPPEALPAAHSRALTAYACVTIVYRTTLYVGIALLVYHSFFKALGLALFAVEVSVFLVRPITAELREWRRRAPAIRASRRTRWVGLAAAIGIVALFLPLDRSISLPAVLMPVADKPLGLGEPARVERVLVANGATVVAGQPLAILSSPDLLLGAAQARLRIAQIDSQLARAVADRQDLADASVLERDRLTERDRLSGLERRIAALTVRAGIDGRVVDLSDGLRPGTWTSGRAPLMRVVSPGRYEVAAFAPETEAWRIAPGGTGRFVPDAAAGAAWRVRLDEIGASAIKTLDQPILAARNGGPIATEAGTKDDAIPVHATIALHLIAERRDGDVLPQPIAGRVVLPAAGQSVAARIARSIETVLTRETSLQ